MNWHERLLAKLPYLGHRNWVLVVDSAYPLQNATGVETVIADEPHSEAVSRAVKSFERFKHVNPVAVLDAELEFLDESLCAGVDELKKNLSETLADLVTERVPHEDLLLQLSDAASVYSTLVIKTPSTIPYSSVFFRLECGYWDADREATLRARTSGSQAK